MIIHGVEIEDDIDLPETADQATRKKWLDIAQAMKPGSSALVTSAMNYENLVEALQSLGIGYIARREGTTGTRVWRTS